MVIRLNPYSNGTLSDNPIREHFTTFETLIHSFCFCLCVRELIHLELFFRKCRDLRFTIQVKIELKIAHLSIYQLFKLSQIKNHIRKLRGFAKNAQTYTFQPSDF